MKPYNVLSLCDGISCGRLAFLKELIPVNHYYASEIDPFVIAISNYNFGTIKRIGDINYVNPSDYKDIDIIIGGTPCQDLSRGNVNGKGLAGEKSKLFFEFVRILKGVNPKYFLFENVESMKKIDKDIITKELGVEPIMINSSLVSGQSRKRLYWTNIPGVTQPIDKQILLKDILEDIPFSDPCWKILDEKYSTLIKVNSDGIYQLPRGKNKGGIVQGGKKSSTLTTGLWQHNNFLVVDRSKSLAVTSNYQKLTQKDYIEKSRGQIVLGNVHPSGKGQNGKLYFIGGKSPAITTNKGEGNKISDGYYYRKLTVRECARLQTIPDWFKFPVSNSQAYKAIGNGWTVDVIAHILSFIPND